MKKYEKTYLSFIVPVLVTYTLLMSGIPPLLGSVDDPLGSGGKFNIMVPTLMVTFEGDLQKRGIDAMIPVYASIYDDEVVAYIPPHSNVLALELVTGDFSSDVRQCTPLLDSGAIKTNRFFKIENNASQKDGFVIFANPRLGIDLEALSALYVSEADVIEPSEAFAFLSRKKDCQYILDNKERNFNLDTEVISLVTTLRVTHYGNDIYEKNVIKNFVPVYSDPGLNLPVGLIIPEKNYHFSAYKVRLDHFSDALPCSPQYQKQKLKKSYELHFSESIKIHRIDGSSDTSATYWLDEKFISEDMGSSSQATCREGLGDPLSEALVIKNLNESAKVANFSNAFAGGLNIKYTVPVYLDIRQSVKIGSIAIGSSVQLRKESDKSYDVETLPGSPQYCNHKTTSVVVAIDSSEILLEQKYRNYAGDKWINTIFLRRDSDTRSCGGALVGDLEKLPASYSEGRLRSMDGNLLLPVRSTILSSTSKMHSRENPYPIPRGETFAWDITTPFGLTVHPVAEGVIDYIGCNNAGFYGCWVLYRALKLPSGDYRYTIVHAHLNPTSLNPNLKIGSVVDPIKTVFGTVSCAGLTSFGPHTHFEIRSPSGVFLPVDSVFNQAHMLQRDFYSAHGLVEAQGYEKYLIYPKEVFVPKPIDLSRYDFETGILKGLPPNVSGCRPNLEMLSCFANLSPSESSLKCFNL